MIDTREELMNALAEAAEVEHGLACQYLFCAFSLKQRLEEGINEIQQSKIAKWKGRILRIAREEMAHLATVSNLLVAIGGSPHFSRPTFPQPARYYSPDVEFALEKFGEKALDRFVQFEMPKETFRVLEKIAPEPVPDWPHVGDLYRSIQTGIEQVPEKQLFIGQFEQDDHRWGANVQPRAITDQKSALTAIKEIINQGEGTESPGPESHFQLFVSILKELREQFSSDHSFNPARDCQNNPLTRKHRDTNGGNLILHPTTIQAVELFNVVYDTMLLGFIDYYAYFDKGVDEREQFSISLMSIMKGVLRPLGEILTELPFDTAGTLTAGPSFEIYGPLAVSSRYELTWKIILERLLTATNEARRLANEAGAHPRLLGIAQSLELIVAELQAIFQRRSQ